MKGMLKRLSDFSVYGDADLVIKSGRPVSGRL